MTERKGRDETKNTRFGGLKRRKRREGKKLEK